MTHRVIEARARKPPARSECPRSSARRAEKAKRAKSDSEYAAEKNTDAGFTHSSSADLGKGSDGIDWAF